MTPAGRFAAAIEVLAEVEERRAPISEALKDWGKAHRFAGSGDRAAIGNVVYDSLRWRASSAWVAGDDSPRSLVLATLAKRWGMGAAGLAERLAGQPHAPEPLTPDEVARIDGADFAAAPDAIRADVPDWAAPRLARVFGEAWVAEGEALALRPPLDMRVNRLKSNRAKVAKALAAFAPAETPYSPDGLRIAATSADGRHPNVQAEGAFQKGWFEVQDEGSQLAALLTAAKAGEQVLDLCAGAGGKTLALAAMMEGKGRVIPTDSDRQRLAPIFERVKRGMAHNVEVRAAGAKLDDLAGKMDLVLIDAPCTGSGTWRRRPDSKWKLTERALGNRIGEQAEILAGAARFPKVGGRLVYVTCSVFAEENEDQVAAFAAANPGFRIVPPADVIARAGVGDGFADAAYLGANGLMMSPGRTGTDGFFAAMLERTA